MINVLYFVTFYYGIRVGSVVIHIIHCLMLIKNYIWQVNATKKDNISIIILINF